MGGRKLKNKKLTAIAIFVVGIMIFSTTAISVIGKKVSVETNKKGLNENDFKDYEAVKIGSMVQYGDPSFCYFSLKPIDFGRIYIDPDEGTSISFYCEYDVEVRGDRDDVFGYIQCIVGGAGYDEFRSGTATKGGLKVYKTFKSASTIVFKLHFEYTDNWGMTTIAEQTKTAKGYTSPKTKSKTINIKIDIIPIPKKILDSNILDSFPLLRNLLQNIKILRTSELNG